MGESWPLESHLVAVESSLVKLPLGVIEYSHQDFTAPFIGNTPCRFSYECQNSNLYSNKYGSSVSTFFNFPACLTFTGLGINHNDFCTRFDH